MTIYRIQDSLGLSFEALIAECELDPGKLTSWRPWTPKQWRQFLQVYQLLQKYSIPDQVIAVAAPAPLWTVSRNALKYRYLIQGRHLDYIQLHSEYPLSRFVTIVDAALEEY